MALFWKILDAAPLRDDNLIDLDGVLESVNVLTEAVFLFADKLAQGHTFNGTGWPCGSH